MKLNDIIKNGKEVIRIEAAAVADLQNSINEDFVNAVETIFGVPSLSAGLASL